MVETDLDESLELIKSIVDGHNDHPDPADCLTTVKYELDKHDSFEKMILLEVIRIRCRHYKNRLFDSLIRNNIPLVEEIVTYFMEQTIPQKVEWLLLARKLAT
jgi:hypothetical protein